VQPIKNWPTNIAANAHINTLNVVNHKELPVQSIRNWPTNIAANDHIIT
jgi:hypothetical protein